MAANSSSANMKQKARKVLIVDDQPLACFALQKIIEQMPAVEFCGGAGDKARALELVKKVVPDLITLEINSPQFSDLNLIREVRLAHPKMLFLVISNHEDILYAERSFRAGAAGFINKRESLAEIQTAIKTVLRGGIYVSEKVTSRLVSKIAGRPSGSGASVVEILTDRELQVFELIGEGFGPKQVSQKLTIDKSTVETYRTRIKKKLRFKTAVEVRKKAIEWNRGRNR